MRQGLEGKYLFFLIGPFLLFFVDRQLAATRRITKLLFFVVTVEKARFFCCGWRETCFLLRVSRGSLYWPVRQGCFAGDGACRAGQLWVLPFQRAAIVAPCGGKIEVSRANERFIAAFDRLDAQDAENVQLTALRVDGYQKPDACFGDEAIGMEHAPAGVVTLIEVLEQDGLVVANSLL